MALKTVKRVTISLPKSTVQKLELQVPKNKRSKFIADAVEKQLEKTQKDVSLKEVNDFWRNLANEHPLKEPLTETSEEMIRKDRMSH